MYASATPIIQAERPETLRPIDLALSQARHASPVIDTTIRKFGEASIREYGRSLLTPPPPSVQDPGDFIRVVRDMTARLHDEETAASLAAGLRKNPVALTANHHGVDYFAQSVQGSLIFGLLQREMSAGQGVALVLSCGNIPLDNITYPQGMLIYGVNGERAEGSPRKMPIFSNKLRRWIVFTSPGYTKDMIHRALSSVGKLEKTGVIGTDIRRCMETILAEDYGDPAVSGHPDYSSQASLLNHRFWRRLHVNPIAPPRVVFLELEKVAASLLAEDIHDRKSLAARVFFDERLRRRIFKALDGHRACWQHQAIPRNGAESASEPPPLFRGTHFFWGISENGRKFPLMLSRDGSGVTVMRGADAKGRVVSCPLLPEPIEEMIRTNRIVPSIFSCFLTLAFARGVNCLGGYYQAEYLPSMQAGLLRALSDLPLDREMADTIGRIPTAGYLSGMQTVMTPRETEGLVPAGPIEIIAGNGLTELDAEKILAMTVEDAHMASLFETIPDISPENCSSPTWKDDLSRDCLAALVSRVVKK